MDGFGSNLERSLVAVWHFSWSREVIDKKILWVKFFEYNEKNLKILKLNKTIIFVFNWL